jgi:hypothetical protein
VSAVASGHPATGLGQPTIEAHFTPTYSSWLNQVECWCGLLTDKQLRRGTRRSIQALEKDVRTWTEEWNT